MSHTIWSATLSPDLPHLHSDFVELSALDLPRYPRLRHFALRVPHGILMARELPEQLEKEDRLFGICLKSHSPLLVVSVSLKFWSDPEFPQRLQSFFKRCQKNTVQVHFDFGRLEPPPGVDREFCVHDPLWFKAQTWGRYWKVHGWHEDRWVRRYSVSELEFLIRKVQQNGPEYLVLGHSQRADQIQWIRDKIAAQARTFV